MNLYKSTGRRDNGTTQIIWTGTQADANAAKKQLKEDGLADVAMTPTEVPTSKADLLAWLNENCAEEGSSISEDPVAEPAPSGKSKSKSISDLMKKK